MKIYKRQILSLLKKIITQYNFIIKIKKKSGFNTFSNYKLFKYKSPTLFFNTSINVLITIFRITQKDYDLV